MTKNIVEQLRYAASDENQQFCEALVIQSRGRKNYVLHRYYVTSIVDRNSQERKAVGVHEKIDYKTKEQMLKDFPYGLGGFGDIFKKGWKTTDSACDFSDVSVAEFTKADKKGLELRLSK